jgi:hypothetical protein
MSFLNRKDFQERKAKDLQIRADYGLDITLGKSKDEANHMADIVKVSMRTLDGKSPAEQLRVLKNEYAKVFDKASHLNKLMKESTDKIELMTLEKRETIEQEKRLKNAIVKIVSNFPGVDHLKDQVEKGTWNVEDITSELQIAVKNMATRIQRVNVYIDELENEREKNEELEKEMEIMSNEKDALIEKNGLYLEGLKKILVIEQNLAKRAKTEEVKEVEVKVSSPEVDYDPFEEEVSSEIDLDIFAPVKEPIIEVKKVVKEQPVIAKITPSEDKIIKVEPVVKKEEEAPYKPHFDFDNVFTKSKKNDKPKVKREVVLDIFNDNISTYVNNLTSVQKSVLQVVGNTGVSRLEELRLEFEKTPELKELFMERGEFNQKALGQNLKLIREMGIFDEEKIHIGGKVNPDILTFHLSEIGKQAFKYEFRENPAITEKTELKATYKSLQRAYILRDLDTLFISMGYSKKDHDLVDVLYEKDGEQLPLLLQLGIETEEEWIIRLTNYQNVWKSDIYIVYANNELQLATGNGMRFFTYWITKGMGREMAITNKIRLMGAPISLLKKKPKHMWTGIDFSPKE